MSTKIEPKLLKGFRDFTAKEIFFRQYLQEKVKKTFELFGFSPLETPALEYLSTFKTNIGEDEKLFYQFKDNGDREVALRYDQTVPTCRYVALNHNEIQFPYKRYQIQPVWRAEKPQKGRYREFLQCDADIFGVKGAEADAEVIALGIEIFKNLGFTDFVVKINDRSLFKDVPYAVIVAIDKLPKIGEQEVIKEIVSKGYNVSQAEGFLKQVSSVKPNKTLMAIFSYLETLGIENKYYMFAPDIARSFSYSNGPIWEIVIPGFTAGSVLGGERFDNLVGKFSSQEIPGTGFGLGFDRTLEAMAQFGLLPEFISQTKVLVTVFSQELFPQSLKLTSRFRKEDINTEIYSVVNHNLNRQLKYASSQKIPYVVVLGEDEIKKNLIMVKNMEQKSQHLMTVIDFINLLNT